jgi:para-aminobenzoate synthetase/4-amino-4-deoxychorismate lyase
MGFMFAGRGQDWPPAPRAAKAEARPVGILVENRSSLPIELLLQISEGTKWLHFDSPVRVLEARDPASVVALLRQLDDLTRTRGYHAAGFLTYEAGAAFGFAVRPDAGTLPLAWFALFEGANVREVAPPVPAGPFEIGELHPSLRWPAFQAACDRISRYLADGDTYQVNFTWQMRGRFRGDPRSLFAELTAAQQGRYGALLRIGAWSICSASPELFLARRGSQLVARPMKGTAPRGRSAAEDDARARELQASEKNRAENVMVVDMVRNDLGRIAETGSVDVRTLFAIERYPTVLQMTSEVTARSDAPLADILAAAYPSASITGAPKVRTMEIIRELEAEPRGVYTGAIGYVSPDGTAQFNVAIRTAVIDHLTERLTFGVGSGIVWDSSAKREYEECLLKAEVLRRRARPFELLETLRWTPESGFFLLDRHLERMQTSARYFGMAFPPDEVRASLRGCVAGAGTPQRVRLLLAPGGVVRAETAALDPLAAPVRVRLAAAPIDPSDPFLFHKTTNRAQYDAAQRGVGTAEPILWNPEGHVTESAVANVVVERGGVRVTPPVDCGLLAGTFRAELLARGEIQEAIVTIDELRTAPRIWLINSVREWRPATLEG